MQITDEAMKAAVVKAVIDSMSPDLMQEMVSKTLTDFLTKPDGGLYGPKKTKFEEAFEIAVWQFAREAVAKEVNENGALKLRISKVISDAIEKAFSDSRQDDLINNMAGAIAAAFKSRDY